MRRRYKLAVAQQVAGGLAHALEALLAGAPLQSLEAEVEGLGAWTIRVSAAAGREPVVSVEKA
jgi:hypothetical protein